MSEIVARKTRKLGPKWPNTVNRRVTKIGDSTKFAAAWTDADGNALASIEVGPLHGVAQIVGPQGTRHYGLVVGGAGFTLRRAYRNAWDDMRVRAYNVRTLLRQRARLLRFAREAYDRMKRFEETIGRQNGRILELLNLLEERDDVIAELKRQLAERDAQVDAEYRERVTVAGQNAAQWYRAYTRLLSHHDCRVPAHLIVPGRPSEAYPDAGAYPPPVKPSTTDATAEAAQEATS